MTFGRFLATLYAVLFLALSLYAGMSFLQTSRELANLRAVESENRERLKNSNREYERQQRKLTQLREDPQAIENALRRGHGYVKPDEIIFRFRDTDAQSGPSLLRPLN